MTSVPNSSVVLSTLVDANNSGKRVISHAANQSVRPYSTNQEYLYAMREDLADWLKGLYAVEISVANFFEVLETGTLLCKHANNITTCADYIRKNNIQIDMKYIKKIPTAMLVYNQGGYVRASSFFARDNIANFIGWCRNELQISDSVMFETNDLVLRNNEKNVILCLLEVARRGSKFGVPAPVLIQMEEEIDEEIELEKVAKERNEKPKKPVKQKVNCDFKSLDEMVQYILGMCTCPSQFPMVKVSDGKYKVGDSENLIFMRILRQHVMVRVGGGWDTLEHYLNKHDPCRCQKHRTDRTLTPRHSRTHSVPSSQPQQRALTSTGTIVKATSNSKRLMASGRLAQSSTSINELSQNGKLDKSPERRRLSSQSRHSSTNSDTSTVDKRVQRPASKRISHSPDRSRGFERSQTPRKDRLSLPSDVFNRLSRPKSTPPIRGTSVFQEDQLFVQRNKKGGHQVQRTSGPANPKVLQSENQRPKSRQNDLKSRSSTSLGGYIRKREDPPNTNIKATRQRHSLQASPAKPQPLRTNTPRTSRARSKSTSGDLDGRELELLQAFEKECIANQYTLKHDQLKPGNSNVDTPSESYEQRTSCEDNEVAQHMQASSELDKRPSRPPSSYNSLPRPRKDRRDQHEKRSRIPTPVSFHKPLLSSKNIDIGDDKKRQRDSAESGPRRTSTRTSTTQQQASHVAEHKPVLNGHASHVAERAPSANMRHGRTAMPVEMQINRLLNADTFNPTNDIDRKTESRRESAHVQPRKEENFTEVKHATPRISTRLEPESSSISTRPEFQVQNATERRRGQSYSEPRPDPIAPETRRLRGSENGDSSLLRSTAYADTLHLLQSAFVPIENRTNDIEAFSPNPAPCPDHGYATLPRTHQPYSSFMDNSAQYRSVPFNPKRPVNGSLDKNMNQYPPNSNRGPPVSRLPSHILQTCGLTSNPCFETDITLNQNGIPPSSANKQREPQWV